MASFPLFGVALIGFSLVPILGGLFVAYLGKKTKNREKIIKETESIKIAELRPGTVEVKGTARVPEDGSAFLSPINRDEALAAKVVVQRYEVRAGDVSERMKTIYSEREAVPFVVENDTGSVRVEPPSTSERKMLLEMEAENVSGAQETPERIRKFVERRRDISPNPGKRREYSEGVLEPGEEVYVLGTAREQDGGWGEDGYVIDEPADSGEFVISDKPEEQLVKENRWQGALLYAVGGIAVFMGVLLLLVSFFFFL